jgi:carbamoyltransferase
MIILSINEDHNATAAILKDGVVLACASEERYSRKKNDIEYPYKAIEAVLSISNVKASDIDYVAYAGIECDPVQMRIKRTTAFKISDYVNEMHQYWKRTLIDNEQSSYWNDIIHDKRFSDLSSNYYDYSFMENEPENNWPSFMKESRCKAVMDQIGIPKDKINFIDHHKGHAYYAYYGSEQIEDENIAVITADGWGDGCNGTISVLKDGKLHEIHRTAMCNMGRIYRWMTLLLGMKPNEHEFKVMGLAPYTKDYIRDPAYEIFKETLVVDGLDFKWNVKPSDMYFYFKEKFEGIRFDGIAAGLQLWLEDLLSEWVTNILEYTGAKILYYSGGLAMNVKANKVLAELPLVNKLFVSPSGGDESLAIGAAYVLSMDLGVKPKTLKHVYLGDTPSDSDLAQIRKEYINNPEFSIISDYSPDDIADLLIDGKVLGRCSGGMEFGARSLGNRAILCDPSKYDNIRIINEKIKFRDFWMPFTPSILEEREKDYLVNPKDIHAEYMTIGFDSTELAKDHLKAAIHPYDFTVRPQLVSKKTNPEYHAIIKAFESKTGIGVLLNTSLNLHGDPIVCSAEEAMYTLINSGLDGMIFSEFLILKKRN